MHEYWVRVVPTFGFLQHLNEEIHLIHGIHVWILMFKERKLLVYGKFVENLNSHKHFVHILDVSRVS